MEQQEAWKFAQKLAKENNTNCYDLFGCDTKIDLMLGVRCKGNCEEMINKYNKEDSK